jgi:CYTH domain-containing protein
MNNQSNIEIERKWLVKTKPDLRGRSVARLQQGYMVIGQTESARIRSIDRGSSDNHKEIDERKYILTIKKGSGLVRSETEVYIPASTFYTLWPTTAGAQLEKMRIKIPLEGQSLIAEYDIFEGPLSGLEMVEVEFATEEQAIAFVPPKWFGPELTLDKQYSNLSLAINGLPRTEPIY